MLCLCKYGYSQEMYFDSSKGELYKLEPYNLYLGAFQSVKDEMHPDDESKHITISGSTVNNLSRFYENSTLGFQHPSGYVKTPNLYNSMSMEDKGITISFWMKISDLKVNRSIGFIGTSYAQANGAKVDFAVIDKRIVVRKRTPFTQSPTLSPIISTDFTLDFEDIVPESGDVVNGFIYFSFASNDKLCRISASRPGGRAYTRLYYTSLTDILTEDDCFFIGRSPVSPNLFLDIPNAFDDMMIYNKYISTEDQLNAFYLQSPIYPGVSYAFGNIYNGLLMPEKADNTSTLFGNQYFVWTSKTIDNGSLSYSRWFARMRQSPNTYGGYRGMSFLNAHSGGIVYEQNSSNYFYQLLTPATDYPYRAFFNQVRDLNLLSLYDPKPNLYPGFPIGQTVFQSNLGKDFYLGVESGYLYLSNASYKNNFRTLAASKVNRGAAREIYNIDQSEINVMIKNYGTNKYLDRHSGPSYYYVILKDRDVNSTTQKFKIIQNGKSDYNNNINYAFKSSTSNNISPYWGSGDQKEDEYLVFYNQNFNWEILYVKDDANNKPLYAIRANNERGSFIIGYKSIMGSNPMYIIQTSTEAYDVQGNVMDNFLWSFDVLSVK